MNKLFFILIFLSLFTTKLFSQTGIIKGRVSNTINNENLPFASIHILETELGANSDDNGNYEIKDLKPGTYNIECTLLGFQKKVEYEIVVENNKPAIVDFKLETNSKKLKEVKITAANKFYRMDESPLSVRNIGSNEIQRNPGSNRDISKVIQNLPGVASTVSYRNDLLVRGGGPSENRFYLDGVEIPNINHFATQGSTGGPVGLLNVDFIRDANFYSGAFPANRGNSMSSVLDLTNKNGRTDHWGGTLTSGYTASGLSLEGPLGSKASALLSFRQSYLQVLFKQIGLPFLPTFNDYQFKISFKPNKKNEFMLMGLGAIDKFKYNFDALNTKDSVRKESAIYILGNLATLEQNNNTIGTSWKHYRSNGFSLVVLSSNCLVNNSKKYKNNQLDIDSLAIFKYKSIEADIKLRAENTIRINDYKINFGLGVENTTYTNSTFNKISLPSGITNINFSSRLNFMKYSVFSQITKNYFNEKLTASLGLRSDFADYSSSLLNPLNQLSPRLSASYTIAKNAHINFNTGIYYQLPSYTILGYRNSFGDLVNKNNNVKYIRSNHVVLGADYFTKFNAKFSAEGFLKYYQHYPFSIAQQVSLANLGGDFGIIGNEAILSINKGRAYGFELSYQQKLYKGIYGIFTYTYVRSEFENQNNKFVSASWDYRNIVNATIGKKLKRNWEIGTKIRYQGGQPYTPYDIERSLQKNVWDITKQGLLNYNLLNTQRTQDIWGIDIRIDKKYLFKKWALIIYADVQNVTNAQSRQQDYLSVKTDSNGNPILDPNKPGYYLPKYIVNSNGVRTPNIGVIVEL